MRTALAPLILGTIGLGLLAPPRPFAVHASEGKVDFARDVEPLLKRACLTCHSETLPQAGLTLSSRAGALKGGVSGPALVPGDPAQSLLIKRVTGAFDLPRMPMGLAPLTDAEVSVLEQWVTEGAEWPEPMVATVPPVIRAGKKGHGPDFLKDIKPIFESRCTRCHGPALQRNQLRLDSRTGALRGGVSGKVVVPGRSADSIMIQRLLGLIQPRMPFEGPPLPASDIARLREWIDAGAPGPADTEPPKETKHWAYLKPVRPEPPGVKDKAWVRNPVDAFVLARLEKEGLPPSPEATRETLIRRLSLDLIGLPPTLAEIDAYLADTSPDAYEKVVDRLLASPHYGERWARPWLDLARYADTNGYEKDRRRVAWKYRDSVIAALNEDKSFRDFTIEQMAGDMLTDATVEQKIATGFHRNTLLNQEGGIDVEEARWETLVDRVNTTASVWLGSTMGCAQCHDHKYDPFSQKDYYRLMAFFDNAEYRVHGVGEKVMDKWIVEPDLELATSEQATQRTALRAEAERLRSDVEGRDLQTELSAFERDLAGPHPVWTPLEPVRFTTAGGARLSLQPDRSLLASGKPAEKDTYTITLRGPLSAITALRLDALPDPSLPSQGPGRTSSGAFVLTSIAVKREGRPIDFSRAAADVNEDGRQAARAIDAHDRTGWGVTSDAEVAQPHFLVVALKDRLVRGAPGGAMAGSSKATTIDVTLQFQLGELMPQASLGRFRISATTAANPWGGLPTPDAIKKILATGGASRTDEQRKELLSWFRPLAPSLDAARDRLVAIDRELEDMKVVTAQVMRERPGFERPSTPLRIRGSYLSPGERQYAATPAFLPPLPANAPTNRLGLARWLVDEENPLTARVTVNRMWEQVFGRGLVLTSEDFGSQGEAPTHPELLDFLATEFVRQGWSPKKLLRLIVTSATYRQSSRTTPALTERDPYNRLLARGPRFRVEAEAVRDLALSVSGLLSAKVGGPSVFPDQPDGVWDNPYSSDKWKLSEGEDRYRRSLYTFVRRTAPYPMLTTFDAPSREFCTVRRVRTNTPLQALTTLNDPAFFAAARALAERVAAEAGLGPEDRIARAFRLCTCRTPGSEDIAPLLRFYQQQADRFAGDPAAAAAVVGVQPDERGSPAGGEGVPSAEKAALTMVANVLLNLDETLTKE
jgi:Protein of unknown function (DUF1553)/Protein of unknown function (DUF1549)/Planctomycete cytochrome C